MADIQNLRLRKSEAATKPRPKLVQNELKAGTPDLAFEPLGPTRVMSPLVRREGLAQDHGSKLDLFSDDGGVQQDRYTHRRAFPKHRNDESVPDKKT